jgi:hypothetical protein
MTFSQKLDNPRAPVLILADHVDCKLAYYLTQLFRSLGPPEPCLDVVLTGEGSPADEKASIEGALIDCKVVLLVYGKTHPRWVNARLDLIAKLKARWRRGAVHPLVALLLAPPPKPKEAIDMRLWKLPHETRVFDYMQGISTEIRPLLKQLAYQ